MATDVGAGSKHTPAGQEYLDSLSARLLMEFRNYLFSPTYIALNTAKFLDHEWVHMGVLPAQTPVNAMQSDDMSAPVSATAAAPSLPEFRSAELATDSVFSSLVTVTPLMPEFSSVGLAVDSTFDFLGDFNWNLDVSTYSSNFDSQDIDATDNCNAVIPSNFDTPVVDPLDDFFASYGFKASSTDLGTIIDPGFASVGPSDLPMLPLPPPESLPAASPAFGQSSEPGPTPLAPKSVPRRRPLRHTWRALPPVHAHAPFTDIARDALLAAAPELAGIPAELICHGMRAKAPQCSPVSPPDPSRAATYPPRSPSPCVRPLGAAPVSYPMHMIFPVHAVALAAHCAKIPRLPPSTPAG
ncbi:hypothetical protein DFH09DRAFT_1453377 [Mycena vulgaris]|nr:hypothetical protein DFH09DRAFT_1453377 [Mycena vulgaris]